LNNKGVSIIICCYNSELLLEQTLNHLAIQNMDIDLACEIIVVDNASTDNTQEKARASWLKNATDKIKLSIVYEPKPGLAYARQRGIIEAAFEYLVFCDDDNWLDKDYINNVCNLFNSMPEIAVLGGTSTAQFEDETLIPAWFDKFYHSYAIGPQAEKACMVNSVYGAGMAVRKSVLTEVMNKNPMFLYGRKQNKLTSGEDSEICYRILLEGYKIFYSPQLMFKHFLATKRLNWEYLKRLHVGLAQSNVVLTLYEKALNSNHPDLSFFYWLKKALYYWGVYFKYWPKHYLAYKNGEGTIEEIHHLTWKNIAIGYLKYNFETIGIYRKIFLLKNHIQRSN